MRLLDRDGNVPLDVPDDGTGGNPEVQRGELRRMLLDSLPAGTVRWDHKVSEVRTLGDGRHEVAFVAVRKAGRAPEGWPRSGKSAAVRMIREHLRFAPGDADPSGSPSWSHACPSRVRRRPPPTARGR